MKRQPQIRGAFVSEAFRWKACPHSQYISGSGDKQATGLPRDP